MPVVFNGQGDFETMHDARVRIALVMHSVIDRLLPEELVQAVKGVVVADQQNLADVMRDARQTARRGGIVYCRRLRRSDSAGNHRCVPVQTFYLESIEFLQRQ